MSTTPPPPPPPPAPPAGGVDQFFDSIRRAGLVRADDRWIGGVASGLSLRAGVDPLVGRALFVLAFFLGGLGLVVYGVAWALLPEQRDGRIHLQELFRGRFDIAVVGAFLAVVAGLSSSGTWLPWWGPVRGDWWPGLVWVAVLATVVVLVITSSRRPSGGTPPYPPYPPYPPAPPPPFAPATTPSSTTDPTGHPMDTTRTDATAPLDPTSPTNAGPAGTTQPTQPGAYGQSGYSQSGSGQSGYSQSAYGPGGAGPTGYGPGGSGPGGYGPGGYGGAPPVPPTPPAPPRPLVRGAGATATGAVVGLGLVVLAGLMLAERYGTWDGPVLLTAGAVTVVLAGLGIVLAGLRGRSSGGLGAVAVVTVLVLLPAVALERSPWTWDTGTTTSAVGELRHTPRTVAEAEAGYGIGAGEARIDLTELPTGRGTVTVPISVGAGEVVVTMPRDGAYSASVQVFAGEVVWLGDTALSGVGQRRTDLESPAVRDGATPRIALDITVGAGQVRVVEAGR